MEIDVITSRSGHPVPKVGGYQIHSVYNPIKEAAQFVENQVAKIQGQLRFLVFGGGYGYHVNALADHLENQNVTQYQIYVVEPNRELREYCIEHNTYGKNVVYIENTEPSAVFRDSDFVKFLIQKPILLTHQASFNLNKDFFESFLTYKSSRNISDLVSIIKDNDFKKALLKFNNSTIDEATLETKVKRDFSYEGLLIQAFASIAGSREENL